MRAAAHWIASTCFTYPVQRQRFPEIASRIVGFYRPNPRGFGFVVPETPNAHGDLFIRTAKNLYCVRSPGHREP